MTIEGNVIYGVVFGKLGACESATLTMADLPSHETGVGVYGAGPTITSDTPIFDTAPSEYSAPENDSA